MSVVSIHYFFSVERLRWGSRLVLTNSNQLRINKPVADSGFPRGGGANSPGGASTYDFAKISQKLHEIERIWSRGGTRPKFYYVDPPLQTIHYLFICLFVCLFIYLFI